MTETNGICIVTGATGGIGKALVTQLAEEGYSLVIQGRNEQRLNAIESALAGDNSRFRCVVGDINQASVRDDLFAAALDLDGELLALINAAGTSDFGSILDLEAKQLESMLHTNTVAPILLCRDFVRWVLPRQDRVAVILNIGSTFGTIGYPGFAAYGATKFALRGFTQSLRRELADSHVRVQYIAPRATRTGMNSNAVDRLNETLGNAVDDPKWVAAQIIRVLHGSRTGDVYLGWPEKFFAWLNRCVPAAVDSALASKLETVKRFF